MRKPYLLKAKEIDTMLTDLAEYGEQETHNRILGRAINFIEQDSELDDKLLDMHEIILNRARMTDSDSKDDEKTCAALYMLASLLRIVAHKVHLAYLKKGGKRDNPRFIRLASSDAVTLIK